MSHWPWLYHGMTMAQPWALPCYGRGRMPLLWHNATARGSGWTRIAIAPRAEHREHCFWLLLIALTY